MTEPELNERQNAVLGILSEHDGRSMDAATVGEHLIARGHLDAAWGRSRTQAGGRGQALSRSSGGATKATRSAQQTLSKLVKDGYVKASRDETKRYRLTEEGQRALP